MSGLSPRCIAEAYEAACLAELAALKPGNVHVFAAGHRMRVEDFRRSATVSSGPLSRAGSGVGERVLGAVEATSGAVGQNTNLGILLLCAPLAAAAERGGHLRTALDEVLAALDMEDARRVYAAIRLANPAGLGRTDRHDVAEEPDIDLRAAMAAAAERDRIAHAYVTGFQDLFETGLSALTEARSHGLAEPWPATAVHFAFLAGFRDSHICRKHGAACAEEVRAEAAALGRILFVNDEYVRDLLAFDISLKLRGLNPGTTADLTVATLFLDNLLRENA
ncbi:triphosphoribosyl-dephospho-CoA synthase [Enterovirga sp. CN4-39]|uniref:triphosphoribosyl-dephospho-CoA synthase n=1 Tax=Enterovirga sp. CN4-39 TaxID=3400910 RepID=UPI003C042D5D